MTNALSSYKLEPGYAMQSSRRHPREPEIVVIGQTEITQARCVGSALIDGSLAWLAFKMPGQRKYFFQYRPW